MTKQFKQVEEFNLTFKQVLSNKATLLNDDESKLCISLLQEELNEYMQAVKDSDIVEIADALIDLDYVLKGVMLKHGLGGAYGSLFDEVHASNMSKVCDNIHEANRTINHYNSIGIKAHVVAYLSKYLIIRTSDGKILKSVDYLKANLEPILNEYTGEL